MCRLRVSGKKLTDLCHICTAYNILTRIRCYLYPTSIPCSDIWLKKIVWGWVCRLRVSGKKLTKLCQICTASNILTRIRCYLYTTSIAGSGIWLKTIVWVWVCRLRASGKKLTKLCQICTVSNVLSHIRCYLCPTSTHPSSICYRKWSEDRGWVCRWTVRPSSWTTDYLPKVCYGAIVFWNPLCSICNISRRLVSNRTSAQGWGGLVGGFFSSRAECLEETFTDTVRTTCKPCWQTFNHERHPRRLLGCVSQLPVSICLTADLGVDYNCDG